LTVLVTSVCIHVISIYFIHFVCTNDHMIVIRGHWYNLSHNYCILWCIVWFIGSVALSYDYSQDHMIFRMIDHMIAVIYIQSFTWSYVMFVINHTICSLIMICDRSYDLSHDRYLWSFVLFVTWLWLVIICTI